MEVDSYVAGHMYALTFASDSDKFDSVLPIYNTMIHSLHFSAGNSTGGRTTINALPQTNNSIFSNASASNIIGNISKYVISGFERAIEQNASKLTVEDCIKTRELPPEMKNLSALGQMAYKGGLEAQLKACKEVGK